VCDALRAALETTTEIAAVDAVQDVAVRAMGN